MVIGDTRIAFDEQMPFIAVGMLGISRPLATIEYIMRFNVGARLNEHSHRTEEPIEAPDTASIEAYLLGENHGAKTNSCVFD